MSLSEHPLYKNLYQQQLHFDLLNTTNETEIPNEFSHETLEGLNSVEERRYVRERQSGTAAFKRSNDVTQPEYDENLDIEIKLKSPAAAQSSTPQRTSTSSQHRYFQPFSPTSSHDLYSKKDLLRDEKIFFNNELEVKEQQVSSLHTQRKNLQQRLDDMEVQNADKAREIHRLRRELRDTLQIMKQLRIQSEKDAAVVQSLESDKEVLKKQLAKARDQEIDLERRNRMLEREHESHKEMSAEKIQLLEKQNAELRDMLQRRQDTDEVQKSAQSKINTIIANKDVQITILQEQVKSHQGRIEHLNKRLQDVLHDKVRELNKEKTTSQQEIQRLNNYIQQQQQELEERDKLVFELQQQMSTSRFGNGMEYPMG